jgi:hypothetical protein
MTAAALVLKRIPRVRLLRGQSLDDIARSSNAAWRSEEARSHRRRGLQNFERLRAGTSVRLGPLGSVKIAAERSRRLRVLTNS